MAIPALSNIQLDNVEMVSSAFIFLYPLDPFLGPVKKPVKLKVKPLIYWDKRDKSG